MTRETAINKLNWALDNNTIEDVQSAYEYIIALKMAIKALEQESKWIPVSERLPEREGWYLTSLGDKTYGGADVDMYCKGWVKYGTHVLAWMPLPEPYEPSN